MNTTSYIVKKDKNFNYSYSNKKNNKFQIFILKIKGILLSFNTTGFLPTFSFFLFTRKYRSFQVIALSCENDKKEVYYYKAGKNSVNLRKKYNHEDLQDLVSIDFDEYKSLGNIEKSNFINKKDQKLWITKLISFLYFLRYKPKKYPSHLLGSGRFAAGVILPNIIRNCGRITGIYNTLGNSSNYLAESFGIQKDVLIENIKKKSFHNSKINLFILSSPHKHLIDIKNSIDAGYKNIYCEKPAGINYKDLEELKNILKVKDINITFGFNRRFAPSIIFLKNLLKKIDSYHITYLVRLAEYSESMSRFKKGGGTTICSCCHYIDLLTYLNGPYQFFDVKEIISGSVSNIDGFSFELFLKNSEKISSSLRFIKAKPGFKGSSQEEIIISSDENEIRIKDFKEISKNGIVLKKFNRDIKGWDLMIKTFLSEQNNKNSSKLFDGINNLELCLEIDKILAKSQNN